MAVALAPAVDEFSRGPNLFLDCVRIHLTPGMLLELKLLATACASATEAVRKWSTCLLLTSLCRSCTIL